MATSNTAQLNMGYMYFPTAMLAKTQQPKRRNVNIKNDDVEAMGNIFGLDQAENDTAPAKDNGAANFIPKNGSKRFSANQLAMITLTHKMRSTFGDFGRLPHAFYEGQLKLSHVTVNHNLAKLRKDGILQRNDGINNYYINPDIKFSEKSYLVIYNYLFDELDCGKEIKKINFNAVILLCYIISHYYEVKEAEAQKGRNNIKPEDAFFIGGKQRIATLLNVAESTANDAVWELLNTAAIYRKAYYIDDNGQELISDGKGNSGAKQTVYVLNTKIIRCCEKVRAKMNFSKRKRAKKASQPETKEKPKQASERIQKHKKKAKKPTSNFELFAQQYQRAMQRDEQEQEQQDTIDDDWAATFLQKYDRPPEINEDK